MWSIILFKKMQRELSFSDEQVFFLFSFFTEQYFMSNHVICYWRRITIKGLSFSEVLANENSKIQESFYM